MTSKASVGRWALGCLAALALIFSPVLATQPALAATQPHNRVELAQQVSHSTWQAKKKKRHNSKIANPDTLPQPLVEIIPGSSINLLSRSSKLPISIRNRYANSIKVRVRVQASNLKVLIPAVVEVLVPANTTVTAQVPVNAIADGPVVLHATLESFSGNRLTVPVDIQMNVILGLENTVLYGFLGFVAALAAFGVYRTMRKRRRETQLQEGQSA